MYGPLDKQKIFTDCSDAMHRGGIVPNPGQPVSILIKVYLQLKIYMWLAEYILMNVHLITITSWNFYFTRMTVRTLHKNASLKISMKQELNVQRDGLEEEEKDNAIKFIEVPQSITKKLQGNKWFIRLRRNNGNATWNTILIFVVGYAMSMVLIFCKLTIPSLILILPNFW